MKITRLLCSILFLVLLLVPGIRAASMHLNNCFELNESISYYLESDLIVSNGTCIAVTKSGASLDCQNHMITSDTGNGTAVRVIVPNARVSNCFVNNFIDVSGAVVLVDANKAQLSNMSVSNALLGIDLTQSNNVTLDNINISSNVPFSYGLKLFKSNSSELSALNVSVIDYALVADEAFNFIVKNALLTADFGMDVHNSNGSFINSLFDANKISAVNSVGYVVQSVNVNVSNSSGQVANANVTLSTGFERNSSITNVDGLAAINATLLVWNSTGFYNYSNAQITAYIPLQAGVVSVALQVPTLDVQNIVLTIFNVISKCTNVTTPGVYTLNQSLVTDGSGGVANPKTCIDIQVPDVTLNGNGFNITAAHGLFQNQLGVKINASNVTVQNLVIYNYSNAINTTAIKLSADGVGSVFLANITLDNVTFLNVANALTTKGKLIDSVFSNILISSINQSGLVRFNMSPELNGGTNVNFTNITIYDALAADASLVDFNVSLVNSSMTNVITAGNAKGLIDLINSDNVLVSNVTSNATVRSFGIQSNSTNLILSNLNLNLTNQTVNPVIAINLNGQQGLLAIVISNSSISVSKGLAINTNMNLDVISSTVLNNLTLATANLLIVNLFDSAINTVTQISPLQGLNEVNVLQSVIVNVLTGASVVDNAFGEVDNNNTIQNFTTNSTGNAYFNLTTLRITPLFVVNFENVTVNASKSGFNANQSNYTLNSSVNCTQVINLALTPVPVPAPVPRGGSGGGGGSSGSGSAASHPVAQNVTLVNVTNNTPVVPVIVSNESIEMPVLISNASNQTVATPQSSTGLFPAIDGNIIIGGVVLLILIGAAAWYAKRR